MIKYSNHDLIFSYVEVTKVFFNYCHIPFIKHLLTLLYSMYVHTLLYICTLTLYFILSMDNYDSNNYYQINILTLNQIGLGIETLGCWR